jgi:hypothetical protein
VAESPPNQPREPIDKHRAEPNGHHQATTAPPIKDYHRGSLLPRGGAILRLRGLGNCEHGVASAHAPLITMARLGSVRAVDDRLRAGRIASRSGTLAGGSDELGQSRRAERDELVHA